MATKKRKKKVAKAKARVAKRSSAGRPKKTSRPRPKKSAIRKTARRKASATSATTKKKAKRSKSRAPSGASKGVSKKFRREDRPGHLDPRYAADLREHSGEHEDALRAFIERPRSPRDDLAEELGEGVVEKATSGEDEAEDLLDQIVPEEQGGPFVETNATQEFAHGTDPSNPKGAKREPFPTT
jgi:hypothetical protein